MKTILSLTLGAILLSFSANAELGRNRINFKDTYSNKTVGGIEKTAAGTVTGELADLIKNRNYEDGYEEWVTRQCFVGEPKKVCELLELLAKKESLKTSSSKAKLEYCKTSASGDDQLVFNISHKGYTADVFPIGALNRCVQ